MSDDTTELRVRAEALMRQRRFDEAIAVFEEHLRRHGDDLRALLELGICHLLNRGEEAFLRIGRRASRLLAALGEVPGDVRRLWSQYNDLARRVTATALVVGAVTLPSCSNPNSGHKYSGGVYKPPVKVVKADQPAQAGEAQPAAPTTQQAIAKPKPKPMPTTFSAHRYSGGVRLPLRRQREAEK